MHPLTDYIPSAFLVAASLVIPNERQSFDSQILEIDSVDSLIEAQALVGEGTESEAARSITLKVAKGDYVLENSFHIARSNVSLVAEPGARFILEDEANCPVIAIGSQNEWVDENDLIENIQIEGIEVDGNRDRQTSELNDTRPWIRNNGIDVRGVRNLEVNSVVARNNRSGGLVISWKCSDVFVQNSRFEHNYFDGVAYYDSARVFTTNCIMRENQFAGISLDNHLLDTYFAQCIVVSNGNVGVFARNTIGLQFDDCVIRDSADWAIFLAHDEKELGVHNTDITHCHIEGNRGGIFMASVNESQSSGTRIHNSRFVGNNMDRRGDIESSGSEIAANGNEFKKTRLIAGELDRSDRS